MVALVPPKAEAAALSSLAKSQCRAWVAGRVEQREDRSVELVGAYRS
jgi:hypothetical protein